MSYKINNSSALYGAIIITIVLVFIFILPLIFYADPLSQDLSNRLKPPFWDDKGNISNFLGTDQLGRDILSRLIIGTRISLFIGISAVLISFIFGVCIGMLSGYLGGRLDLLIQRIIEIQISFPFVVIALIVMAFVRATPEKLIIVFGITGWVIYGRIIRGVTLTIKERQFVEASISLGASHFHIIKHHIFPNIINTAIVLSTLELSVIIYAESALSFLGIGIQPPTPSLGVMLGEGRVYLSNAWWLSTFPGLILMFLILGVNFLGDGLREILDPTLNKNYY